MLVRFPPRTPVKIKFPPIKIQKLPKPCCPPHRCPPPPPSVKFLEGGLLPKLPKIFTGW